MAQAVDDTGSSEPMTAETLESINSDDLSNATVAVTTTETATTTQNLTVDENAITAKTIEERETKF